MMIFWNKTENLTTGVAIYAYFILANDIGMLATAGTYLSFILDDEVVGQFARNASLNTTVYQYNVPVYANPSIHDGQHILSITSSK